MFDLYGKTRNTTTSDSAYQGETLWAKVEGVEHTQAFGTASAHGAPDSQAQEPTEQGFLGFVHALFTKKAA